MTPETHDHDNEARRQRRITKRSASVESETHGLPMRHTNRGIRVAGRRDLTPASQVASNGFTVKAVRS